MIPTIFGYPLWRGKIKKRIAKKYLRRYRMERFFKPDVMKRFTDLGIGSYVNDCSGFNGKITEMYPTYRRIGKGKGAVLLDVDFQTENTGCCLGSCGVEPALSQEEVEKRTLAHLKAWTLSDGGKTWYGEGTEDYLKAVARANQIIKVIEEGGHITDEFGKRLPEFDR